MLYAEPNARSDPSSTALSVPVTVPRKKQRRAREAPDHVDVHVGYRIRARRTILGITQGTLAEGVGVTFQQIQKYEKGRNRVSASKLFQVSLFLKTPVTYFFEGMAPMAEPETPHSRLILEASKQLYTLSNRDLKIARRMIQELAKAASSNEEPAN